jgi:hypothetical protein
VSIFGASSNILLAFFARDFQSEGTLSQQIQELTASLVSNAASDCSIVRSVPTGSAGCASCGVKKI